MTLQNIFFSRQVTDTEVPFISSRLIQLPKGFLGVLITGGWVCSAQGAGGGEVITGLKKSVLENKLYNSADHNPFGI